MNMPGCLALAGSLALTGCTAVQVPDHPDAIASIQSYYATHAWEDGARCVSPSMNVTQVKVLYDTRDHVVVEARYYWRDGQRRSNGGAVLCSGFATRTFTLSQDRVVAMTGEQRR